MNTLVHIVLGVFLLATGGGLLWLARWGYRSYLKEAPRGYYHMLNQMTVLIVGACFSFTAAIILFATI
ncbi:hypothetical protein EPO04_02730 [Patescibacteria group bacterium]|nr:MAG: hypothetical protein EPO04_02730 [Patescibacteria group bacterium]